MLATKLICPRGANKAENIIFLTSKEDHTYVRGEIYQRLIAIRKSKKQRFLCLTENVGVHIQFGKVSLL